MEPIASNPQAGACYSPFLFAKNMRIFVLFYLALFNHAAFSTYHYITKFVCSIQQLTGNTVLVFLKVGLRLLEILIKLNQKSGAGILRFHDDGFMMFLKVEMRHQAIEAFRRFLKDTFDEECEIIVIYVQAQ